MKINKKIELDENQIIVFVGSMNAMPMMYAWELKKKGYEVLYFVDRPTSDTLSRPENHFAGISYPYPEWIIEISIPSQMVIPYFPKFYVRKILANIRKFSKKKISCFFLNGFFISLSPLLSRESKVIALSHGSDLDVWANKTGANSLANSFSDRSLFKYLPKFVSKKLINKAVTVQHRGFCSSYSIIYFPSGFNAVGDAVIKSFGVQNIFERYDISFEPLKNISRNFKNPEDKIILFCGVRFLYKTFPDGNLEYSKGNDLIIKGISRYFERNKNIEVHFVEKGEDVLEAKKLCIELGIDSITVWHKEMPFKNLLNLYIKSDVCFDQVGLHWIGAIGAYALYLGKPLIANAKNATCLGVFPADNPILSVANESEIYDALIKLENLEFRKNISIESKKFVEFYMGPSKILQELFVHSLP